MEDKQHKYTGTQIMLLNLSTNLLKRATAEDFVMISKNTQPTQFTGKNHNSKTSRSGGKPPPEYAGIEALEDLRREVRSSHPDFQHMARCYLHLSSILRY